MDLLHNSKDPESDKQLNFNLTIEDIYIYIVCHYNVLCMEKLRNHALVLFYERHVQFLPHSLTSCEGNDEPQLPKCR